MAMPFIDLKTQYQALKPKIDARIQAVLDHGQYIMGPEIEECEKKLAAFVGSKHALAVASGTDAAMMALMALGVGPGDEVITSSFTFVATIETIVLVGATPVLVDIDPETFNLDVKQVEAAITSKTKAIMPVSLYGQPADMDEINTIARAKKLFVIEDACQSFGAPYKGKRSGHLSDLGVTSFFPAKPLGCYGDGGAIFTDNDEWAQLLAAIRVHGQTKRYFHPHIGVNGRLDTIQCAILCAKMERYPWELEQREKVAARYTTAFRKMDIRAPLVKSDRGSVWAQYTIRVPNRDEFQRRMNELGVPTAVHYPSTMAEQPAYTKLVRAGKLPHATLASREVVSLPMYPDMTPAVQDQIIAAVEKCL